MAIYFSRFLSYSTTSSDFYYSIVAFLLIISLIYLSRLLKKRKFWQEEWSGKLVHISVGALAAYAPFVFDSPHPLVLTALIFGILNFYAIRNGYLDGIHGHRNSYGTVYFPLSYIMLIMFCWYDFRYLITIGILLFAVADALAAIIGQFFETGYNFQPIKDKKSLAGSITMFISSFFIFLPFGLMYIEKTIFVMISLIIIISLIITVVELLSSMGSDNFFVPISGALCFFIAQHTNDAITSQIFMGSILSILVSALSIRFRFLSLSGSLMTFLLATSIFGLGGVKWALPILIFFILSSLLSKAGKRVKEKFEDSFEKSGVRDYAQVLANGGIGGILVIINSIYPTDLFFILYLISLSVATADTWATEIGVLFRWKPVLVTNFKKVNPGTSGAISLHGTVGGFIGSLTIVSSGVFFISNINQFYYLLLISMFGFLGSLIDSVLGATLQAQYQCMACNKYTEKKIHCQQKCKHIRGLKIINNDFVNFFSSIAAIFIYITLFE